MLRRHFCPHWTPYSIGPQRLWELKRRATDLFYVGSLSLCEYALSHIGLASLARYCFAAVARAGCVLLIMIRFHGWISLSLTAKHILQFSTSFSGLDWRPSVNFSSLDVKALWIPEHLFHYFSAIFHQVYLCTITCRLFDEAQMETVFPTRW